MEPADFDDLFPGLKNPRTLDEFLERPTRAEWEAELETGWEGPDGSSCSFDHVLGALIGRTGWDYSNVDLAANRHDWYYRLGRRLRLPESYRRAADRWYRDRLVQQVKAYHLGVLSVPAEFLASVLRKARVVSTYRYLGLRAAGIAAWKASARPPGGWPDVVVPGRKVGARVRKEMRNKEVAGRWLRWRIQKKREALR